MRRLTLTACELPGPGVYLVLHVDELATFWREELNIALLCRDESERTAAQAMRLSGLSNVGWLSGKDVYSGDVVAVAANLDRALVLYRENDVHHAIQLTNRCNSRCLMCSQPPTPQNDAWLADEAIAVCRHIRLSPRCMGLTGGEPLLLGADLRLVLDEFGRCHLGTHIEVLTNGRLLADTALASQVLDGLDNRNVTWLVPLYGHADFLHDFVVQAPGAFEETIAGILELQARAFAIQLRIVLIEPVLKMLPALCQFIGMNLPFVREVALMGCEPIGFALANRELCEVDLQDWTSHLDEACRVLERHRLRPVLMNVPLCCLPRHRWVDAHRSISDWKNVFAEECKRCVVRDQCSGLFAWHEKGWKPTRIRAILEEQA